MHHTSASRDAVNQLHQEADGLAAVASLCCADTGAETLEHVPAAHLQSLLHGFATRLRDLAHHLEQHVAPKPKTPRSTYTDHSSPTQNP